MASWRGWAWNHLNGVSWGQLGEGSNKSCELGHLGPKPPPSQGTEAGEHWGPGICWAGGQTKLPLLKLQWAHPPQPTCPSSHLLPPPQAAPFPSLAWEEAQRGGLSQRRKPAGPWGHFPGWEGSLSTADQEG